MTAFGAEAERQLAAQLPSKPTEFSVCFGMILINQLRCIELDMDFIEN